MNHRSRLAALLSVLFLVSAASAAPDDDGWTEFKAPPTSPGGVIPPSTSEGGYSSSDRTVFSEKMKANVLEQICRAIKIQTNFDFGVGDFAGIGFGPERYMTPYPDGTYALVDVEKLHASLGHTFSHALGEAGAAVGLSFSGSIEGDSMVVRRLNTKHSCEGLKELVDLRDIKTVLPVSAKRISAMGLGELWRIPFTLTYGQGLSVGDVVSNASAVSNLSVTFGRSDAGSASMTLFRIADDQVRFRFRIDHVVVHSKSLNITETFPAVFFAGNATNILMKFVDREIAKEVSRYSSAWMSYGRSSSDGAKIVMEFVIDPRDPEQAQALASAVKGDIYELVAMGIRMSTLRAKPEQALHDYEDLRDQHAKTLGAPTYAASDHYMGKMRNFALMLPFFITHNSSKLLGNDKVTLYTGEGGEYRYFRSDKSASNAYFNVPLFGAIVKDNSQRAAEVVTYAPEGQPHADPIMVYVRNQGYLREPAGSVRSTIDEMNGILKLAGAQRGDRARELMLPADKLVPPSPPIQSQAPHGQTSSQEPSDRKGMVSLTLVFNQNAVRDIIASPDDMVVRAYAKAVSIYDRSQAEWLANNATITPKGAEYDWQAARKQFEGSTPGMKGSSPWDQELRQLSAGAANLLADLAAARNAPDAPARSAAMAKLVGGRGKGDLAYENVLRVLVQLVDPLDVSGDFVANVNASTKGVPSVSSHLVLKNGRAEVPLLKDAGDTKNRFAQPSILVD